MTLKYFLCIGDEKLPSSVGIISPAIIKVPSWTKTGNYPVL